MMALARYLDPIKRLTQRTRQEVTAGALAAVLNPARDALVRPGDLLLVVR